MSGKPKVGDVFLVPVHGDQFGLGQVAGDWKGELYVVIYDRLVPQDAAPSEVNGGELLFAALTLDAKFYHGNWPIIGNVQQNLALIPQPWFKIAEGARIFVESRDRSATRLATATEVSGLRLRKVVAPVRFEKALRALHGYEEWQPHYDELRADYAVASERLAAN